MCIEEVPEEDPGGNTKFQQKEEGDGRDILVCWARAPVEDQEDQGSECKIVDKAADEGPGHFGEVQFEVAQIFYKNGANDNIASIEDNQKILKAFRITLIEKNPNEKKRRVQDKQIDREDQQMDFPGSQSHWKRLRL